MASTQDLKRRLRSITNTRKLTRAMELVASARLRRAQQRIEAMRPYADRMLELMAGVSQAAGAVRLPLLDRRETIERVAIVPVAGGRGLVGLQRPSRVQRCAGNGACTRRGVHPEGDRPRGDRLQRVRLAAGAEG